MSQLRHVPNQKRYWREQFDKVIEKYEQAKGRAYLSVEGFYHGLESEGGRTGHNPKVVRVTPSDLVCDVELTARRALNNENYHLFMSGEYTEHIQERVGLLLLHRGVAPLEDYMRPTDTR